MNDTQEIKYWPRLFRPGLMQTIESGQKTQTRRPLVAKNTWFNGGRWPKWASEDLSQWAWEDAFVDNGPSPAGNTGPYLILPHKDPGKRGVARIYPRVRVGDVFWTKETFAIAGEEIVYQARDNFYCGKWKPSIFQKFEHARFHLPITDVRIVRLRSISDEDAMAEGVVELTKDGSVMKYALLDHGDYSSEPWANMSRTPVAAFSKAWDNIYRHKSGKWEENRWVLAYSFDIQKGGLKCEE